MGSAQIITVLSSLAKTKAIALILGPSGVGLVGLYTNLVATASSVASLGIATTGVRSVVEAQNDPDDLAVGRAWRSLFWITLVLGCAGGGIWWGLSPWIARVLVSDPERSGEVAWLAIGVGLSVAVASQSALLKGMHRVAELAKIAIGAATLGAVIGVGALNIWSDQGIVAVVLAMPVLSFVTGWIYLRAIGKPAGRPTGQQLARDWRALIVPGIPFMLSGVAALLGLLAVQTLVARQLGPSALGNFQAAWSISMTYLGFVLGAMAIDYFPRLVSALRTPENAVRLVNEQTELSLLLCAPMILLMLGFSPWVIRLLYSPEFSEAVEILRWQLLGDALKVMSWPLGYLQQARSAGRTFLLTETISALLMGLVVFFCLPRIGLEATGIAVLVVYATLLPILWWLGRRWIKFTWTRSVKVQAVAFLSAAILLDVACRRSDLLGAVFSVILAACFTAWAVMRLTALTAIEGGLAGLAQTLVQKVKKRSRDSN